MHCINSVSDSYILFGHLKVCLIVIQTSKEIVEEYSDKTLFCIPNVILIN